METTQDIRSKAQSKVPDFLLAEYVHMSEAFLRNEELGEKRAAFFVTLVGVAGAMLGFVFGEKTLNVSRDNLYFAAAFVGTVLLCLGFLTVRRLIARDIETDNIKFALRALRRLFLTKAEAAELPNVFFGPYAEAKPRPVKWLSFGKGGWLHTVAFVNAFLMFIIVFSAIFVRTWDVPPLLQKVIAVGLAFAGGVIVWWAQLTSACSAISENYIELKSKENFD